MFTLFLWVAGIFRAQAVAAWQWYNCLSSKIPVGKAVLRINMDETSVCLWQGQSKGTVLFRKRRDPPGAEPVQRADRRKRRTCLTYVSFICDRPALQPLLPQVIIGNFGTFLARDFPGLQAASPGNVELIRQKSAWNDAKLQARIVRKLGLALRPFLGEFQPVLLMDAVPLHFAEPVRQACFAWGLWPVIIPAKMTFLLQPCDTHVFQAFKQHLRSGVQEARLGTTGGELTIAEFLACMYKSIRQVVQGQRWSEAFDKDGFGAEQTKVSSYVRRQLGLGDTAVEVPSACLTQPELELCFPKRARVTIGRFLRPAMARPDAHRLPVGFRLRFRLSIPHARLGSAGGAETFGAPGLSSSFVPGVGREPRTRAEHRLAEALVAGHADAGGREIWFAQYFCVRCAALRAGGSVCKVLGAVFVRHQGGGQQVEWKAAQPGERLHCEQAWGVQSIWGRGADKDSS